MLVSVWRSHILWTKHLKQRIEKRLFHHSENDGLLRFSGPHSRSMSPTPSGVSAQAISVPKIYQSPPATDALQAMDLRIQSVRPANGGSVFWSAKNFKCWIPQTGIDKHLLY